MGVNGRNKYGAQSVWYCRTGCGSIATSKPIKGKCASCGAKMVYFASQQEFNLFHGVEVRERVGEVTDLVTQPAFPLIVCGVKIANPYHADFAWTEASDGRRVVVDVKGVDTREGKLRRKLAEAIHGIKIEVWR